MHAHRQGGLVNSIAQRVDDLDREGAVWLDCEPRKVKPLLRDCPLLRLLLYSTRPKRVRSQEWALRATETGEGLPYRGVTLLVLKW
jgi:hypothetical protein